MSKAKYYIYRNLHTGTFSVKYKGKVIAHPSIVKASDVEYRVSAKGRAKVLSEKKKYVHAYVVCSDWQELDSSWLQVTDDLLEVYYNPYTCDAFMCEGEKLPRSTVALLANGKVYTAPSARRK